MLDCPKRHKGPHQHDYEADAVADDQWVVFGPLRVVV